jgi:ubiquinone/menaquinone biosynthesis C-methylase UbiE
MNGRAFDRDQGTGHRVARHYSSEAEAYRDLWAPILVGLARWLIDDLPLRSAGRILEVGCGVGALLPQLKKAAPRSTIVGLDRAEGMLRLAPRDFPLVVGDAAHLPFADGSFDTVVMAFMLFHLARPAAGLAEARRVLKPGGWIGLLTWGNERDGRAWDHWVEELDAAGAADFTEKLSWPELVNTPGKLKRHLQRAKFKEVTSRVESFIERPSCEEFVLRRTSLGSCRYRWESLERKRRQAVMDRAVSRLKEMSPEDFEEESEVIVSVAQRPE